MTYNPNTPQPQSLPSSDQDDFLSNFALLNEFFGVDHIPFLNGMVNGNGKHTKVTFANPLNVPPMTPTGGIFPNSSALYTRGDAEHRSNLYFQNNIGKVFEKQLTSLSIVKGSGDNGFGVKTPWGITINFGQVFDPTLGTTIFNFPSPFNSVVFSLVNCIASKGNVGVALQRTFSFSNALSLTTFSSVGYTNTNIKTFFLPTFYIAVGR